MSNLFIALIFELMERKIDIFLSVPINNHIIKDLLAPPGALDVVLVVLYIPMATFSDLEHRGQYKSTWVNQDP